MTDTSTIAGARPPTNIIAGNTFNPIAGASDDHPTEFPIGTPVTVSDVANGTVVPGLADDIDTATITGLAITPGVVGDRVKVQTHGPLTLTTAQWDEITGGTGGLIHGLVYFLSTDGGMTDTAPTTPGDVVTQIGIGLSPTDLMIQISPAVLLT
jgi:hypothetical protein